MPMRPYLHTAAAVFAGIFAALVFGFGGSWIYDLAGRPTEVPRDWLVLVIQTLPVPVALLGFFGGAYFTHRLASIRQERDHDRQDHERLIQKESLALWLLPFAWDVKNSIKIESERLDRATKDDELHIYAGSIAKIPKELTDAVSKSFLLGGKAATDFLQFLAMFGMFDRALSEYHKGRVPQDELLGLLEKLNAADAAIDTLIAQLNEILG